jgi:hypothetical protein
MLSPNEVKSHKLEVKHEAKCIKNSISSYNKLLN